MSDKPKGKLAIYWAASCGGCEISILAIDEKILNVAEAFDIVMWPCATDGKVRDVEKMPDQEHRRLPVQRRHPHQRAGIHGPTDAAEIEGPGGLRLLRQRGLHPRAGEHEQPQEVFDTVYKEGSSTVPVNPQDVRPQPETKVPEGTLHLPIFYDTLKTLDQTVDVDYYLPGCPPEAENIWTAIVAILEGKLPPKGSVIGLNTTVCDECPRKRNEKKIKKFYRTWQMIPDEETCLLEQGLLCCGIATRAGCKALCPAVNSPCIGCHGANDGVADYGARLMSAVASVIDSNDPDEIDRIISEGIPDPVGSFYRFSLASSQLRRKKKVQNAKLKSENAKCARGESETGDVRLWHFAFCTFRFSICNPRFSA